MMIPRHLLRSVERRLADTPAVVLLGPRQVGKTTLARAVAAQSPDALILDLERDADRAVLANPELFLPSCRNRLLVFDQEQDMPGLFAVLRSFFTRTM